MKKNVVIILLSVVILGLGGYLVYDKVLSSDNDIKEKQEANKTKMQVLQFYPSSIAVVNNGEVYVNIYGSTSEIDQLYGEDAFQKLVDTRKKYEEYLFDNTTVINELNDNFKGLKLEIKDVKAIYSFAYGQVLSSNYGLLILKNDNTVHGISLYSLINGKTQTTEISKLKNIEKIITKQTNAYYTYAVDKDGREYDMINYVPDSYIKW